MTLYGASLCKPEPRRFYSEILGKYRKIPINVVVYSAKKTEERVRQQDIFAARGDAKG
jgi:hypothetical protein